MRRVYLLIILVAIIALGLAGCSGAKNEGGDGEPTTSAPPATTPPADTPAPAEKSKYDDGPRAGETAADQALAAKGEKLFQTKGCFVCHGFGKKITCPDLVGVSMRRTATWMEHQILHPEVMVKEDPISRDLKKQYSVPMTNQNVKPDEAKALIEFLKKKDREAGVKKTAAS